ncbi:MAG: 50S ribosome-binding GTPase [Firmicutes bacterium]|nr:50S ribosome-binding GTPase [Bacillota bacterium]
MEAMDIGNLAKECWEKLEKEIREMNHVNIIITGKTGVGKSTLINSVFREKLAEVGVGRPVTKGIKLLTKENVPIRIYDTKGLELGSDAQKEAKKEIHDTINQCYLTNDPDKYINVIWYCVNTQSARLEENGEAMWIDELSNTGFTSVPVIIVLTKAYSKKQAFELKKEIESYNLNVAAIVPVLAEPFELDGREPIAAYGGDKLIEITFQLIPESSRKAFVNAQRANVKMKSSTARKIVAATVAATFGEGFVPIPFGDTPVLMATQVGMIASITSVYGIDLNKAMITAIISSIIGSSTMAIIGRTVSANLLKLIPGYGSVAGGLVSGATAAVLTTALGEAYIRIMELVASGKMKKEDLANKKGIKKMQSIFKDEFKNALKRMKNK